MESSHVKKKGYTFLAYGGVLHFGDSLGIFVVGMHKDRVAPLDYNQAHMGQPLARSVGLPTA